jgi:hypothetical protein
MRRPTNMACAVSHPLAPPLVGRGLDRRGEGEGGREGVRDRVGGDQAQTVVVGEGGGCSLP